MSDVPVDLASISSFSRHLRHLVLKDAEVRPFLESGKNFYCIRFSNSIHNFASAFASDKKQHFIYLSTKSVRRRMPNTFDFHIFLLTE